MSPATTRPASGSDLRRRLLDAAIDVIAVEDPANLSLRAVAREVGVSHAAPKNHFADKTALLTQIAIEGYEQLGEAIARAAGEAASPVEALQRAGRAYVGFSVANPGYFRVMWRNELLDQEHPSLTEAGRATFAVLVAGVEAAQATGWATDRAADDVATMAWATVHGLAQLHLDGPLGEMDGRRIDELSARVVDMIATSLAAPPSH